MGRFVQGIQALAMTMGAPGILLVAFLDSSILSLPEIADILVIYMVTKHRSLFFAVCRLRDARLTRRMPAAVLHRQEGRRRRLMHQRFDSAARRPHARRVPSPRHDGRARAGDSSAAGAVQALRAAWPVSPTSASRASPPRFSSAAARAIFVEGLLALWYGERAMAFIRDHGTAVGACRVGVLAVGFVAYLVWTRRRA